MAPLAISTIGVDDWWLMMASGGVAVVSVVLISVVLCGCCDGKQTSKDKRAGGGGSQRKSLKGPGSSSKSKPAGAVNIKELANKFRVSEAEMQTLVDRFRAMDINKDGSLTEVELAEAMSKLDQPISREQAAKFIKQYDKNGDGSLQLEEFLTMVTRRRKWSQPDANKAALKAFKEFDKNNDGHISPSELCAAMAEMGDPISVEEAANTIKMADKNKDGRISYEEFVDFWKNYAVG